MLSINMDDVIKVLNSIKSQLIGFGVVAVLLIAVMIACRKQSKSKKYLIRWQAGLGMVLGYLVNLAQVRELRQSTVQVGPCELQVSRPKRKAFLSALTDYIGGEGS